MTDRPPTEITPESFGDLLLQPTGSGVADLETAYEQMKLSEVAAEKEPTARARVAEDPAVTPIGRENEGAAGEGHPS